MPAPSHMRAISWSRLGAFLVSRKTPSRTSWPRGAMVGGTSVTRLACSHRGRLCGQRPEHSGDLVMDTSALSGDEVDASLARALLRFVHRLRDAGIPVSMVETLDAAECVARIDLTNRAELRAALAATLVKRAEHRRAFESLFDIYFALRRDGQEMAVTTSLDRPQDAGAGQEGEAGAGTEGEPSIDLLRALLDALRSDDQSALRALAAMRSEEHTSELQSRQYLVCRLLLEK